MSKQIKADLLLLLITAIWGSSFPLMKNVLDFIPSFAYLSLRFIIAAIVLAAILWKKVRLINGRMVLYGGILGLLLFGGMALQVGGLYFTTASNSAFITGLNVVMVPVVSAFFLGKKPDLSSALGVILAFAGMFFLCGGLNFKFNFGDFLTLLCAVCFTMHIILIDKYTGDNDAALLALMQIGFAGALSTIVWGGAGFKSFELNATVLMTLLTTGVLGTALALAGQTVAQKHTTPTHTALVFSAEPVFGAVFALIIPNSQGVVETLEVSTVAGCMLILTGMLVSEFKLGKKRL
ncbi:MAG: DMT family transporter [Clostridia bacterium]|nr:DMT family transporter [Clostridia bacterium]